MQQIINFLIRKKNFLLFIFLLLLSLVFTIQSHSYHLSKFVNSANFLTGGAYSAMGAARDYLNLKNYNKQLLEENTRLRNLIDPSTTLTDSIKQLSFAERDVADTPKKYKYIPGKVLNNNYAKTDNFITIRAGRQDSIRPDMGVITSKGVVGVIDKVSNKYSTILSILNTNFTTQVKLRKSEHFGTVRWDGKNPNIIQIIDMQQQAPVIVGDTIETSGKSSIFPKGIPIGTISAFELDASNNFYTLTVNLLNDMTNLGHVYIIQNSDLEEIKKLEKSSK